MARIQKQFIEFHDAIKQKRFDDAQTLRDKRDIVRKKVEDRLPGVFEAHGEEVPEWKWHDQGSYKMGTGVKPISGDFDIDQGLYFTVGQEYDPVRLKKRVHEALDGHTKKVDVRRPCVTVFYQKNGEHVYHVDIAVYSEADTNGTGDDLLAVGRLGSSEENKSWDVSNPRELADTILGKFTGDDRKQFRRCVRYLKRWRDHNFSSDGNNAPNGIGLTISAYDYFATAFFDAFTQQDYDDLSALLSTVKKMLGGFSLVYRDDEWASRLKANLPNRPYSDVFDKMTNKQMVTFKDKLTKLRDALEAAQDEVDPTDACAGLRKVFGDDFPVPEKKATARVVTPAIASSSSAA